MRDYQRFCFEHDIKYINCIGDYLYNKMKRILKTLTKNILRIFILPFYLFEYYERLVIQLPFVFKLLSEFKLNLNTKK